MPVTERTAFEVDGETMKEQLKASSGRLPARNWVDL
jgi:hypothetical protein